MCILNSESRKDTFSGEGAMYDLGVGMFDEHTVDLVATAGTPSRQSVTD